MNRLDIVVSLGLSFALLAGCASSSAAEGGASADSEINASTEAQDPAVGSPDRAPLMAAVHQELDPQLHGQSNEYVVSRLRSKNGFTVLEAEVRGKGGQAIDWQSTEFSQAVRSGEFKQADGSTKVVFTAGAKKVAPGQFQILLVRVQRQLSCVSVGALAFKGLPPELDPPCVEGSDGDGDGDGDGDAPPMTAPKP